MRGHHQGCVVELNYDRNPILPFLEFREEREIPQK